MENDFLAPSDSKKEPFNLGPSLEDFEKKEPSPDDVVQDFLPPTVDNAAPQNRGIDVPYDVPIVGAAIGAVASASGRAGYIDNIKRAIEVALAEGRVEEARALSRLVIEENIKLRAQSELPQGYDRQVQGTVEGGETGRARQTGYYARTAAEAARLKEMKSAQASTNVPKPVNPLTTQAWQSTPGGVLAPVSEAELAKHRFEMELREKSQREAEQTMLRQKDALERSQKLSQIPAAQRIFGSKILGSTLGVLGGATAGYDTYKAMEEAKQGDYLGATLSGLTALGGVGAMVPHPVVAGVGSAMAAGIPIARELVPRTAESFKRLANRPKGDAPTPEEIAEASSAYYGKGALPKRRTMFAGID